MNYGNVILNHIRGVPCHGATPIANSASIFGKAPLVVTHDLCRAGQGYVEGCLHYVGVNGGAQVRHPFTEVSSLAQWKPHTLSEFHVIR